MSARQVLTSGSIDGFSGGVYRFSEVGVFDGGVVDEVDFSVEKGFEVFL